MHLRSLHNLPIVSLSRYRSIVFETQHLRHTPFYQPALAVNYPNFPWNFTRIIEYKHLMPTALDTYSDHTTIVKEFSAGLCVRVCMRVHVRVYVL